MRLERARFQFGVELPPDEPRVVLVFDDFGQHAVGGEARETQAMLLEPVLIGGVDLVAGGVAVPNLGGAALDLRHPAAPVEHPRRSANAHGATRIASRRS